VKIRNISILSGAVLTALAVAAPAGAAMKATEALDGNWFSPSESGRGISVDFIPEVAGGGTLFGAIFSFDGDGNDAWLVPQVGFLEFSPTATGPVFAVTGGSFGFPFTPPTVTEIGSVNVDLKSDTRIVFELDMDDGSGFEDVTLDLEPLGGAHPQAVYLDEFSGCPAFAADVPSLERACALSGIFRNENIVLTNDTTWVLNGLVQIGDDNANQSTVTIEPGTVLVGAGGTADYLYVNPGSKIYAEGLPWAPIVLTTPNDGFIADTQPQPGEVGGLVVSGNAPCNSSPDENLCFSEFDPTLRYGGNDPADSSGVIKYWQVRYGGFEFQPNREVNSFTFQAAGNGTVISHLQSYAGLDDAVEFFGGTANARYIIGTAGNDDGFDWDEGFSGKIQFGLMVYTAASNGDHGFESANNPDNDDALPRATPVVSNVTLVGAAGTGDGIRFKEGTAGQIWNTVVTGFEANCIRFVDLPTYTAAGAPGNLTGDTAIAGTIIDNCGSLFRDEDGSPWTVQQLFESLPGNEVADPMLDGFMPMSGSPARSGGLRVVDLVSGEPVEFFDFVPYRGAFGTIDWTIGWTHDVLGTNAF